MKMYLCKVLYRNSHSLALCDFDLHFVKSMNELAKELKLSPRYFERVRTKNGKTYGRIMFNGPYCRELFKEGYVRNPALYAHDALVGFL